MWNREMASGERKPPDQGVVRLSIRPPTFPRGEDNNVYGRGLQIRRLLPVETPSRAHGHTHGAINPHLVTVIHWNHSTQ